MRFKGIFKLSTFPEFIFYSLENSSKTHYIFNKEFKCSSNVLVKFNDLLALYLTPWK
jgi:hypothetical protein